MNRPPQKKKLKKEPWDEDESIRQQTDLRKPHRDAREVCDAVTSQIKEGQEGTWNNIRFVVKRVSRRNVTLRAIGLEKEANDGEEGDSERVT